jgi:hypothetical protein
VYPHVRQSGHRAAAPFSDVETRGIAFCLDSSVMCGRSYVNGRQGGVPPVARVVEIGSFHDVGKYLVRLNDVRQVLPVGRSAILQAGAQNGSLAW